MAYLTKKKSNRFMLLLLSVATVVTLGGCGPKVSPQPAYQDAEKAPNSISITGISTTEDARGAIVRIEGNRKLTYTSVKQSEPVGIVFYFPGTTLGKLAAVQTPESDLITKISASELTADGKTARVEIDLSHDSTYTVEKDENGLRVSFPTDIAAEHPESIGEMAEEASAAKENETAGVNREYIEAAPATILSGVSAETGGAHTVINVQADGIIRDYTSFSLSNPPRIVYDLKNVKSPYTTEQTVAVGDPRVERVRYFSYPDKIRLVIETNRASLSDYTARSTDAGLAIQIGSDITAATTKPPVYTAEAEGTASDSGAGAAEPEQPPGWINRIDFSGEAGGKSTVMIGATKPAEFTLEKTGETQLQLRLFHTKLPEFRERPLITTRFESAVDRITPYRQPSSPDDAFFAIKLRQSVPYFVEQKGDLVMVHFEASSVPPRPLEEKTVPSWEATLEKSSGASSETSTAREEMAPLKPKTTTVVAKTAAPALATAPLEEKKVYTGEKIVPDFYDIDIKNVFRILKEVSGLNFAIDKDVSGKVTLSFDQPAPWDQVLDLILQMNQLGMVKDGNIVRIATQDTLKKEESARQAAIIAEQKTKEQELAVEPLRTEYIAVNYSNAKSEVLPHVQALLSPGRGKADVDERNNLIVITDTDRVIDQARTVVQRLDKVTPQVVIEARVVEVNSDFSNELGINWGVNGGPVSRSELGGSYTWDVAMNFPSTSTSGIGFQFARVAGTPLVIDAQLGAIESQSKGKVISAPKIVTLDNKKATIKQGVEIGYFERDDSGGSSTKFKKVDLLLEVTPHVTPDKRVSMTVYITKNDVSGTFNNAPLLATNEANTEFLVNDGETIVIGGILKKSETSGDSGFPLLKDIPGLKWLFKNETTSEKKQELLIFITPKIVTLDQRQVEFE